MAQLSATYNVFSGRFVPQDHSIFQELARYILVFAGDFAAVKIGLGIFFTYHTSPAIIWPATGVALTIVMLLGYRMWFPVFLGHLLAYISQPEIGVSLFAITSSCGYAFQSVAMVWIMRRFSFAPNLNKLYNTFIFILAAIGLTVIAPCLIFITQFLAGGMSPTAMALNITRSWAGGIFSVIVIVPFILTWMWNLRNRYDKWVITELSSAILLLTIIDFLVFWTIFPQYIGIAVIFLLPAVLIWFALRFSPRWTALAIFLSAVVALMGTIVAHPTSIAVNQQLLSVQIYIGMIAAIFYVFVAVVEERRAAMLALEKNNRELERALEKASREDEAKTEFLAILAHELRNPLAPVVSSLELLNIKLTEAGRQDLVDVLTIAEDHNRIIAKLLDDLLDISRITRKKFKLQLAPVELQKLVQGASQTVDPFYRSRNHTLTLDVPREPISFEGDELRLTQILVNLLYNAAKYTNPGGKMTLSARYRNNGLVISMRDNGIGIAPDMIEGIFEPFVQGSKRIENVGTGLGIGLALTKRLVELHKGTIMAKSEGEGKGSEFIISLPVTRLSPLPLAERDRTITPVAKAHGRRVVVVDDNEAAARGLALLLKHRGHTVDIAHDGAAGLALIAQTKPEVVLLDIGLPDTDGYTVARKIRALAGGASIALIALTGYGLAEDKMKAQQAGFDYHLTKPIGLNDIDEILAKHFA